MGSRKRTRRCCFDPSFQAARNGLRSGAHLPWCHPEPSYARESATADYLVIVKSLLSTRNIQPDLRSHRGETLFSVAADEGEESIVEELLRTGDVDPNSKNRFGEVPLLAAARNGHLGIVKRLIGIEGLEADARSLDGVSAFTGAAWNGHTEIVKLLLTVVTVDLNQQTGSGFSPLRGAVAEGHVDAVNVLLANEKVDPNMPSGGITVLAVAANNGQNGIMRSLIASVVEMDVKDIGGKTPLMIAAHKGDVDAVEILLSTGRVVADFDLTMLGVSFSC
ncbi:unnamed protein product [Penicillium discolor]